jgi:hypothetical protein
MSDAKPPAAKPTKEATKAPEARPVALDERKLKYAELVAILDGLQPSELMAMLRDGRGVVRANAALGLAALGQAPDAEGIYNLPCQPAEPTRALMARLAEAAGRPLTVARMPAPLLWVLSLAMPILKEAGEMAYQWEEPFVVDDARFRARFGDLLTPRDEAARATLAWGQATFGPAARARAA